MTEKALKIAASASELGLEKGDTVLVHSSLKSLGEGVTPADVIDGLLECLGEGGTLMLPALSYLTCNREHPVFDYHATKSNVGAIPEYFRSSVPGVIRSMCPTHSCCAKGKNAEYLTSGHHLDNTPCGENSPFRRLMLLSGKILFLGCGMRPNTSMHAVEELSVPDYLFAEEVEYTMIREDGSSYRSSCFAHNFKGVSQRYERLAGLLCGSELRHGGILGSDSYLVETDAMWKKADAQYRIDPHYFIDKAE